MSRLRFLLIEDHQVVRRGIRSLIEAIQGLSIEAIDTRISIRGMKFVWVESVSCPIRTAVNYANSSKVAGTQ